MKIRRLTNCEPRTRRSVDHLGRQSRFPGNWFPNRPRRVRAMDRFANVCPRLSRQHLYICTIADASANSGSSPSHRKPRSLQALSSPTTISIKSRKLYRTLLFLYLLLVGENLLEARLKIGKKVARNQTKIN